MEMKPLRNAFFILVFSSIAAINALSSPENTVPDAIIGNMKLSTQALGQFGTVPHKKIEEGQSNCYAQFSLWAGALTEKGEIRVTTGNRFGKGSVSEWTPLPHSWIRTTDKFLSETEAEYTGSFTDTGEVEGHHPLGLVVVLTSYCFIDACYAMYEYAVSLKQGYAPIPQFYLGIQADIDMPDGTGKLTSDNDFLGIPSDGRTIFTGDGDSRNETARLFGIRILSVNKPIITWWTRESDPQDDRMCYHLLQGNNCFPDNPAEKADYRFMLSEGPYTLNPEEVVIFRVAVLQAEGSMAFSESADQVYALFTQILQNKTFFAKTIPNYTLDQISSQVPCTSRLYPAYPNPFNSQVKISFDLPESGEIDVIIFNLLGRQVKTLFSGFMKQGHHTLTWTGRDETGTSAVSGVYMIVMRTGNQKFEQKIILMK